MLRLFALRLMGRWIEQRTGAGLLLMRAGAPDRWDMAIERRIATLKPGVTVSRSRLARALRQDLWRALRGLRGFTPRVLISADTDVLVTAGGTVQRTAVPKNAADGLATLLDDPKKRQAWLRYARVRRGDGCSRKS